MEESLLPWIDKEAAAARLKDAFGRFRKIVENVDEGNLREWYGRLAPAMADLRFRFAHFGILHADYSREMIMDHLSGGNPILKADKRFVATLRDLEFRIVHLGLHSEPERVDALMMKMLVSILDDSESAFEMALALRSNPPKTNRMRRILKTAYRHSFEFAVAILAGFGSYRVIEMLFFE